MRTALQATFSSLFPSFRRIFFPLLALTLAAFVLQAQAGEADALDTSAPTLPLAHQPLQTSGEVVQQPGDWRAANGAVGAFARGHADIVKWEAVQTAPGHDGMHMPQQPHGQQHHHQPAHPHHMPSHGHAHQHHHHGAQP